MEYKLTDIGTCKKELEFVIEKQEGNQIIEQKIREFQSTAELKGFRKGKAPFNLVKSFYGPKAEADSLSEMFEKGMKQILEETKIDIAGSPKILKTDKTERGFEFLVEMDIFEPFELADFKGIQIDEPVHRVSDEEIDAHLKQVSVHNGTFENAEYVDGDDYIVGVTMKAFDPESNTIIVGEKPTETHIYLASDVVLPTMKANLLNTKKGDTFVFNPHNDDQYAPDMHYQVEVTEIQKLIPIEINNEFVRKYTQDRLQSTEELREEIGFTLQDKWDKKSAEMVENQLIDKLIEMNIFSVPESAIEMTLEEMLKDMKEQYKKRPNLQQVSDEVLKEDLRPSAERIIKWQLIREKITKQEGIKVEEYDISELVEANIDKFGVDRDTLTEYIMKTDKIVQPILFRKVIDYVKDFAITNEVEFEGK